MSLWNPYNWFRSKVWRTHKDLGGKFNGWNTETENKLKIDIEKTVGGEPLNILLVGAASNGKSSTINSIFSIMNGRISCRSNAGSLGESFTIKYRQIQGNGPFKNIFFYDTSGIEEQNGPTIQDIEDALSGGKKPGVKVNTNLYNYY
ncbi:uncharacterized protein LOC132718216 [Ruditapes philippinarum]|uniref:uncharacterized protein LOC132718216 n=1 Tax=Ruditapes philippinarum TaxID=129788 RepID=UPI00295BFCFE|nr:uncharacterized protein LOC132718216 [Ruditapes philippinarum]